MGASIIKILGRNVVGIAPALASGLAVRLYVEKDLLLFFVRAVLDLLHHQACKRWWNVYNWRYIPPV